MASCVYPGAESFCDAPATFSSISKGKGKGIVRTTELVATVVLSGEQVFDILPDRVKVKGIMLSFTEEEVDDLIQAIKVARNRTIL